MASPARLAVASSEIFPNHLHRPYQLETHHRQNALSKSRHIHQHPRAVVIKLLLLIQAKFEANHLDEDLCD
nr:hypothetical protein [Yersinia enterocolitica]